MSSPSDPEFNAAAIVRETLSQIEALQSEFMRTRSPRKQYRLLKETEPLFARLGIIFEPMRVETMRGPYAWWVRGGRRG